jgi:hypothetical protein
MENINTMIIIMDFVVSRLLLTLFALALITENEKIYDYIRKKQMDHFTLIYLLYFWCTKSD